MKKTRAIELLDKAGIAYDVRAFDAVEFTAEEASAKLGLPLDRLFKTLVARGERKGVVMAVVPGTRELSLRKLASAMADKRVDMVDVEELFKLTGYLKGGCSPLGARREFPVFLDASAMAHARISVSAGQRGLQILIAPADLARAARANVTDLVADV